MNVLHKVTMQALRQNKTRTILTVIGVLLSVALFTAVTTFCSSLMDYLWRSYAMESGIAQINLPNMSEDACERIREDERVEMTGTLKSIGYSWIEGTDGPYPYLFLCSMDDNAFEACQFYLTEGRLPRDASEAIVPIELLEQEGTEYGVGTELKLELGIRERGDGVPLWQYYHSSYNRETECVDGEIFTRIGEMRTVTVTGVYQSGLFTRDMGFNVITRDMEPVVEQYACDLFINLKDFTDNYDAFFIEHKGEDWESWGGTWINYDILGLYGESMWNNVRLAIQVIAGLAIFLVSVGAVILIYSAFSISIGERTKQFGLLSSVGASRRQIRRMVLLEAAMIAVIGIPAGIVFGMAVVGAVIAMFGDVFSKMEAMTYEVEFRFCVEGWAIAAASAFAAVTILISVWIPAKRAGRVTAIEAIRQNQDISDRGKPVKVSFLTRKLFGMEGVLAKKYYKRDKRKYRVTVMSMSISVMLVISVSGLNRFIKDNLDGEQTANCDVSCSVDYELLNQGFLEEIRRLETVTDAAATVEVARYLHKDETKVTPYYTERPERNYLYRVYLDDATYERIAADYHLGAFTKDADGTMPGIAVNLVKGTAYIADENGKQNRVSYTEKWIYDDVTEIALVPEVTNEAEFGEAFAYPPNDEWIQDENGEWVVRRYFTANYMDMIGYKDYTPETIMIGAMLEDFPFGIDNASVLQIVYPMSSYEVKEELAGRAQIDFLTPNSEAMIAEVCELLKEKYGIVYNESAFLDYQGKEKQADKNILVVKVCSWGFLVLISLVAAVNVFNTISTNILMRKRDLAMLVSIGMSEKQKRKMLHFECLTCVVKAWVIGAAMAVLILFGMEQVFTAYMLFAEMIPWKEALVSAVGVAAIVGVTIRYSLKRMEKEELMEVLRREVL